MGKNLLLAQILNKKVLRFAKSMGMSRNDAQEILPILNCEKQKFVQILQRCRAIAAI